MHGNHQTTDSDMISHILEGLGIFVNFSPGLPNLSSAFGKIPWTGHRPIARPLPIQGITTHKDADIRTFMLYVGFE
jgi:hypothetical protein